ncbi:MAG: GLUG motif-containing protein, partial [Acutalibacteraceae bacterium]|nr:GLUG motif-containing protein [Acutalibacteraceae bacterium]
MKTKTNRKLRKILSIALCLALVMSYVPMVSITASAAATDITVTIDTGTSVTLRDADSNGYYEIGTADELYAFAQIVNNGNNTINGELTADITVNENVLTEDCELNGDGSNFRVWTPIGKGIHIYKGTFDGGEYTVRGLYFNNSNTTYVGLFGYIDDGGRVQNVGVVDSYISANYYVGGVVGHSSSNSTVTNCYNAGTVTSNSRFIGGVVGIN